MGEIQRGTPVVHRIALSRKEALCEVGCRPLHRILEDEAVPIWLHTQKRRVKRELALPIETQQEIEKEKLAALKGSIQMEEFEDVGEGQEVREPQAGLSTSQNATGKFKYRPTGTCPSYLFERILFLFQ